MLANEQSRRKLSLVLKAVVGLSLLIYLVYHYFDPKPLRGGRFNLSYLALLIILYLAITWFATWRWRFIIRRLYGIETPFFRLLGLTYFGQTMALFTPSRVGDLGRAVFLKSTLSKRKAFITLLYDKCSELLALGLLALVSIGILWDELKGLLPLRDYGSTFLMGAAALTMAAVTAWLLARRYLTPLIKNHLADWKTLVSIMLISLCIMTLNFTLFYIAPLTLGMRPPFWKFVAAGVLQATISMLPITLSGFGLREGASVVLFPLVGVTEAEAIILAWLGVLGHSIVPALIGAATYLVQGGSFMPEGR